MKVSNIYSHMFGLEFMQIHHSELLFEIKESINEVNLSELNPKISNEKTMNGRMLYSPISINNELRFQLSKHGWNELKQKYWLGDEERIMGQLSNEVFTRPYITNSGVNPGTAFEQLGGVKQIDFFKHRIAIEVQLGKYSFIDSDISKHTRNFNNDIIDVGIEIVPMLSLTKQMSTGPSSFEKVVNDIIMLPRMLPAVPLVIIGIGCEDDDTVRLEEDEVIQTTTYESIFE